VIGALLLLFYCFLAHLLGRCLLRSFRASVPNGTGLVETQGLSVPHCYGFKWNQLKRCLALMHYDELLLNHPIILLTWMAVTGVTKTLRALRNLVYMGSHFSYHTKYCGINISQNLLELPWCLASLVPLGAVISSTYIGYVTDGSTVLMVLGILLLVKKFLTIANMVVNLFSIVPHLGFSLSRLVCPF